MDTLISPEVRSTRSGSGMPPVEMRSDTVCSVMSSTLMRPSATSCAMERTAEVMSCLPPYAMAMLRW